MICLREYRKLLFHAGNYLQLLSNFMLDRIFFTLSCLIKTIQKAIFLSGCIDHLTKHKGGKKLFSYTSGIN